MRIPCDIIDSVLSSFKQRSCAAVVAHALERERRGSIAARDAGILVASGIDPDLDALARHASTVAFDLD